MHFYTEISQDRIEPRHTVAMTKDPKQFRPSRVNDAKKAAKKGEVWFPSVTTVLNILDKPALVNWKVDRHLDTAFALVQAANEAIYDIDSYRKVIKARTAEKLELAPRAGTDIHEVLEDFLFTGAYPKNKTEKLIVQNCEEILVANCGFVNWKKEKYFINKKHGYAGCADLSAPAWIVDYKSKLTADKFKVGKMAYPEHARQLASYGESLCEQGFQAANIFICLETGEVDFHLHQEEEILRGYGDFLDCLSIYNRNTYNPMEFVK